MDEKTNEISFAQSASDYMFDTGTRFIADNIDKALEEALLHEVETPKTILFFEHLQYLSWKIFHTIREKILDTIYKHERVVKTRLAGSMMTIDEAMSRGTKCKTLREFADWFYEIWAKWDRNFDWLKLNTFQHSDTPDNRIGWRQTWLVTAPGDSNNHTYPVAYTDKPFYNLKLDAVDAEYIRNKYPKFLECVDVLQDECHRERKLYRKEITKKYGEHLMGYYKEFNVYDSPNTSANNSKTTVKELRDMLDELISNGKGDYTVDLIIFTGYERGHETSDSKIKLNGVDDDDKTILLQGDR